jgi:hypothetical protein
MKYLCIFIFLFSFAVMSGDNNGIDPKMEKYKITDEELHDIALNFYTYMFEEEHEWKGVRVDSSKSVTKNIIQIQDEGITLAYIVNYNPYGHVSIPSYKSMHGPYTKFGVETYDVKKDSLSIDDRDFTNPVLHDYYKRVLRALKEGRNLTSEMQKKKWQKFNVNPMDFKSKANFDQQYPPRDWWLEKKQKEKKFNKSLEKP